MEDDRSFANHDPDIDSIRLNHNEFYSQVSLDTQYFRLIQETLNDPNESYSCESVKPFPIQIRIAAKNSIYAEPNVDDVIPESVLSALTNFLQIRIQKDIEKVDEYYDKYPCLDIRKAVLRVKKSFSELCWLLISNSFFEVLVIFVIICNIVILALEDPLATELPSPYPEIELFFVVFYSIECGLKICSLGFLFNREAYLRDYWNVLDFIIVFTAWLDIFAGSGFKLSALRTFRVLRPLRSISSIKGMRALFLSLINSIKPLLSALVVLFFFNLVFAIGALNLWMGIFKGRCMDLATGEVTRIDTLCGVKSCSIGEICAQGLNNPNYGTTNFDNILISFIIVFQIITMEGWTNVLVYTEDSFSSFSILYYIPLLFIAANLILNLTLAIITSSFKETSSQILNGDKSDNVEVSEDIFDKIFFNTAKSMVNDTPMREKTEESNLGIRKSSVKFDGQLMGIAKTSRKFPEDFEVGEESQFFTEKENCPDDLESAQIKFPEKSMPESPIFIKSNSFVNRLKRCTLDTMIDKRSSIFVTKRSTFAYEDNEKNLKKSRNMLKQAVTVKNKTFKMLKNDPSNIRKSRLELLEAYHLTSESTSEILPEKKKVKEFHNKNNHFYFTHLQKIAKTRKKYSEFKTESALMKLLSLRISQENAFKMLKIPVKEYLSSPHALSPNGSWSGSDTAPESLLEKHLILSEKMSKMSYNLWPPGHLETYAKFQYPIAWFIKYKHTNTILILSVLINTIALAYDHYGISQSSTDSLASLNTFFTYMFTAELIIKFIGLGLKNYFRDFMNYFDLIVVTLSLVEIFITAGGTSAISAFRAIRIFRIFRVLKVFRLFRYLKSVEHIVRSIGKSISSFAYLFMFLLLFQLIFTLLGMQIFAGTFDFPDGLPRGNFDTFHWAFITTFQVLSTENWNDILASSLRSSIGPGSSIFLVAWIILGNFIVLNLFLAILLDSFSSDRVDEKEENLIEIQPHGKRQNTMYEMKKNAIENYKDADSEYSGEGEEKKILFEGVGCKRSYYIFSKQNTIRILCYKINKSHWFDNTILALIVLNSIKLIWDTYIINSESTSTEVKVSDALDDFFTAVFAWEFLLKSVAVGFMNDKLSYLKDNWNKLDFVITIISLLDASVNSINVPIIKLFRLLRALRPLKLINHNLSMKIAVSALMESIKAICNVLVVIIIIWLVFAILGVSLLSGKLYYCTNNFFSDYDSCVKAGFSWKNTDSNFDNIFQAMVTLFIVMSQESWPNRMYEGVDARGVDISPQTNYNPNIAYYYVVFLIIGNFFMVNLFTVIVFEKFNEAKLNESPMTSSLTIMQKKWVDIQAMSVKAKPESKTSQIPKNSVRRALYMISKSKIFELVIMVVILVNMLILAYAEASNEYSQVIEYLNMICTFIFIMEALIKILGLGPSYFKAGWNCFDFFIVSTSIIDLAIEYSGSTGNPILRQGPQLIRVIRVLRVSRLLRLIKSLESLQKLITIITFALPAILNVFSLLMLIFFMYAILGVFLFHSVTSGNAINSYYNFSNFHFAMTILWRISTGEDYPTIMYDCSRSLGSNYYVLYFLSFVTIIDFVVLDLFVSIILQNYEEYTNNPDSAVSNFTKCVKLFRKEWAEHTIGGHYYKIPHNSLTSLIKKAGLQLELLKNDSQIDTIKLIGSMNLPSDSENFFYFNDVLFGLMKKKFFKKNNKGNQEKFHTNLLKMEEAKSKQALKKIRENFDKNKEGMAKQQNLFMNFVFLRTVIGKWRGYATREKGSNLSITPQFDDVEYPGEVSIEEDSGKDSLSVSM